MHDLEMPTTPLKESHGGVLAGARARWVALLVLGVPVTPALTVALLLFDDESDGDGLTALDRPAPEFAVGLRCSTLDRVVEVYSYLGGPVVAITATTAAVVGLSGLGGREPRSC
jgi:hypothetical protein